MFKKDGEVKVFVSKKDTKTASKEEKTRYTVDDLVKDSEDESKDSTKKEI